MNYLFKNNIDKLLIFGHSAFFNVCYDIIKLKIYNCEVYLMNRNKAKLLFSPPTDSFIKM